MGKFSKIYRAEKLLSPDLEVNFKAEIPQSMKSSTVRKYFKIRDHLQRIGCLRTRTRSLKERQEGLIDAQHQISFRDRHLQALENFKASLRDQDPIIIGHPSQAAQNLITGAGNPILSNSQSKLLLIQMNKCNYRCQKTLFNL